MLALVCFSDVILQHLKMQDPSLVHGGITENHAWAINLETRQRAMGDEEKTNRHT